MRGIFKRWSSCNYLLFVFHWLIMKQSSINLKNCTGNIKTCYIIVSESVWMTNTLWKMRLVIPFCMWRRICRWLMMWIQEKQEIFTYWNISVKSFCPNVLSLNDFILSANDNNSFDIANPPFEKHNSIKMILHYQNDSTNWQK